MEKTFEMTKVKWNQLSMLVLLLLIFGLQFSGIRQYDDIGVVMAHLFPAVFFYLLPERLIDAGIFRYLKFYRICVLFMGPFATLGTVLMLCFPQNSSHLLKEYKKFIAADVIFSVLEKKEIKAGHYTSGSGKEQISPILEIMGGNNLILKQNAIDKVVQHPGPFSKIVLNLGLKDRDPDIKFYAASALILINDTFVKKFQYHQKQIRDEPGNISHLFALANTYNLYCKWGLPEKEDYRVYYRKIKKLYREILSIDDNNRSALVELARIAIEEREYERAFRLLQTKSLKQQNDLEVKALEVEALFALKKIKPLRAALVEFFSDSGAGSHENLDSYEYLKNTLLTKKGI